MIKTFNHLTNFGPNFIDAKKFIYKQTKIRHSEMFFGCRWHADMPYRLFFAYFLPWTVYCSIYVGFFLTLFVNPLLIWFHQNLTFCFYPDLVGIILAIFKRFRQTRSRGSWPGTMVGGQIIPTPIKTFTFWDFPLQYCWPLTFCTFHELQHQKTNNSGRCSSEDFNRINL